MASDGKEAAASNVGRGFLNYAIRKLSFKTGSGGPSSPGGTNQAGGLNKATATMLEGVLTKALFIAGGAESRAQSADHRRSVNVIRAELISARDELELAIGHVEGTGAIDEQDLNQAFAVLARIHTFLGNYGEAEDIYTRICPIPHPHRSMSSHSLDRQLTLIEPPKFEKYQLHIALAYLQFLLTARRNMETAEAIGVQLLDQPQGTWTGEEQCILQLGLIDVHNRQGKMAMALSRLRGIDGISYPEAYTTARSWVGLSLARARATAESELEAKKHFLIAIVQSAVIYGMWHSNTLEILAAYGVALKSWGQHRYAAAILGECCSARYYRLGASHPDSRSVYQELETCEGSQQFIKSLEMFNGPGLEDEIRLSMAYKHIHLNTIFDLPLCANESDYERFEVMLQGLADEERPLKIETAEHRSVFILRAQRTLAACLSAQGRVKKATRLFEGLSEDIKRSAGGEMQSMLDLARIYANDESTKPKAMALSRAIFFDGDRKLPKDQARAFRLRLTELGLTHFPHDTIRDSPLPITVIETVGTGAYAVVESVDIGQRLYARKSIALPRYNQKHIRQTIQNEISTIRALAHPHIVQVYCTYEERNRFCIVLEPLATWDLEAYLDQHTKQGHDHRSIITLRWQWLRCLANTVSFMHSKGIRHKDIKARNILVKSSFQVKDSILVSAHEVVFADFGSCHAFMDEGNSTTEGPAFGHTLMYCAPEVVAWDRRSRSADIFSLGCVFTEIATSMDEAEISDYYDFRCKEVENSNGRETHAYHATLNLVDAWFDRRSDEVKTLYLDVIKPMLSRDPETRPTASSVSRAVEACFQKLNGRELPECPRCQAIDWRLDSSTLISEPTPPIEQGNP